MVKKVDCFCGCDTNSPKFTFTARFNSGCVMRYVNFTAEDVLMHATAHCVCTDCSLDFIIRSDSKNAVREDSSEPFIEEYELK